MKVVAGVLVLAAALALAGCKKGGAFDMAGASSHSRYVGVGHYSPGPMWPQVAHADQPKDAARARLTDDEQIIIVMDSRTGEVRQCGNFSGVCITMNPWSKPVADAQAVPVTLGKHADELSSEAQPATASH
jgi:hypothetical protein